MQDVFEEEWSEANWEQGHTYPAYKGASRVIIYFV